MITTLVILYVLCAAFVYVFRKFVFCYLTGTHIPVEEYPGELSDIRMIKRFAFAVAITPVANIILTCIILYYLFLRPAWQKIKYIIVHRPFVVGLYAVLFMSLAMLTLILTT